MSSIQQNICKQIVFLGCLLGFVSDFVIQYTQKCIIDEEM